MDEKKLLKVIDRIEAELHMTEEEISHKIQHDNQTSPIYKKMAMFRNAKIGEKFSIKDLFR